MKVKSANAYRTFYKEKYRGIQGSNSRDEHFIGSEIRLNGSERIWGFFELVNGDKTDIPNFIKHYLDLAPDEQAVFEFLQNAYDAKATRFAFWYDENYLLIFNNGEKIDINGIRSILNVGQSTKDEKSDIGKFGIGFKLAHRLLGQSNGQKEIVKNAGPILFSWNSYDDLKQFSQISAITDLEPISEDFKRDNADSYQESMPYPWLFRILLTSFPAGINESFKDIDYHSHDNMPNPEELLILRDKINQYIISSENYSPEELNTGMVVFIKLGGGKSSKLLPKNIKETLGFSLNTLNLANKHGNQLKEVRLGPTRKDVIYASDALESLCFRFTPGDEEYENILADAQSFDKPESVDMILLYPRNYENFLTKHSNIYLYFPLTEENLKFNFIFHCNCFHNQSSRTGIDSESHRNIKIFEIFIEKLVSHLELLRNNDFKKYTEVYSALLLSEKTNADNKKWAIDKIYTPILNYLSDYVPTKNNTCLPKKNVRIKNVNLDVSPETFGVQNYQWFYDDTDSLIPACKDSGKLNLKPIHLPQLISDSANTKKINEWLAHDSRRCELLLDELEGHRFYLTGKIIKKFADNFKTLRLFCIAENKFLSLNELEETPRAMLLSSKYKLITSVMKSCGITVCELADNYNHIKIFVSSLGFPHLNETKRFLDYFCIKIGDKNQNFTFYQIKALLDFFRIENIDFFSKLILKNNNKKFVIDIGGDGTKKQYYCDAKYVHLKDYLDLFYPNTLIPLSDLLGEAYSRNRHILTKEELYEYLLSMESQHKEMIDLIVESGYLPIQHKYLANIDSFELEDGRSYIADSYESKLLKLAMRLEDEGLKNKTVLKQTNGDCIHFSHITFRDRVIFKNKNEKKKDYVLKLSEIVPKYIELTDVVESVIGSIEGIDEEKSKLYFSVGKEMDKNEIYDELRKFILSQKNQENTLYLIKNAHQLSFVVLYAELFQEKVENDNFSIDTKDEEYYRDLFSEDFSIYYLTDIDMEFLNKDNILQKSYKDTKDLLHLSEKNPSYKIGNTEIRLYPYFKKNEFYLFPVAPDLSENQSAQKQLLKYMLDKFDPEIFEKLSDAQKTISYPGWESAKDQCDGGVRFINRYLFGFNSIISVFPKTFANDEEILPDWVNTLMDIEDLSKRNQFLIALGVHLYSSNLIKLRRALLSEKNKDYYFCKDFDKLIQNVIVPPTGHISRTFQWVKENQLVFIKGSRQFCLLLEMLTDNVRLPQNHLFFIEGVKDTEITYSFQEYDDCTKIYLVRDDENQEGDDLEKIFNSLNSNEKLCHDEVLVKSDDEELRNQAREIEFQDELKPNGPEYVKDYYKVWRDDGGQFTIHEELNGFTYERKFNNICLKNIERNPGVDIRGSVICFSKKHLEDHDLSLEELLEQIVGFSEFTQEDLDDLIEKRNNISTEIVKVIEREEGKWTDQIITETKSRNTKHSIFEDVSVFEELLLHLLKMAKGSNAHVWKGKIYHFTHIESAVSILRNKTILSRRLIEEKYPEFKSSAGSCYIKNTDEKIKNYARFYFRPQTPTQFYNEGLGSRTKKGDWPQCPVPIFIEFYLHDILSKTQGNYYVSNGNLRHYPNTKLGNTPEFLKMFDWENLFKEYGECELKDYLHASQQEFIIKEKFDFSNVKNFSVVCPDEDARKTLLTLLSDEELDSDKVRIDRSYYQYRNDRVEIKRDNGFLEACFPKEHEKGYLSVEQHVGRRNGVQPQIIESGNRIRLQESNTSKITVYYNNIETNTKWLVYQQNHPLQTSLKK